MSVKYRRPGARDILSAPRVQPSVLQLSQRSALACGAALLLIGSSALADSTTPNKDSVPAQLGPVTVTATRTAEPSYDVPASIDSVSADQINDDRLGVNIAESVQGIPGLLARDRHNYAQDDQISIRGFGSNSAFGVLGVRLYYDGIPASFPDGQGQVSNFNMQSASRIEVLRGPFSALYGNSSGGVIQLFTANGEQPDTFGGGITYGSYNTLRANVDANGAAGPLSWNADFTHFRFGGYRDHSSARRENFNGKTTYQIDDASSLTFVLNSFSGPEAQDPQGLSRAQFDANPNQASAGALTFNTRKSVEQTRGGLIYRRALSDALDLRVMGYYGRRLVRQFLSIPIGAQNAPTSSGGVIDLHDGFGGGDTRLSWHTGLLNRPFTLIGGLAYDVEHERRRGYKNYTGSGTCGAGATCGVQGALARDEQDNEYNIDEYLQADWHVAPRWDLLAGVRHSQVSFTSHDQYLSNGNDSGSANYYSTNPVAGLMFRAASWAHAYASFGEGFQTPTFAQLSYKPDKSSGLNLGLKPARSENAELGVKFRLPQATDVDVALFHTLTRNELAIDTNSGGRSTYENIPRTRRQGIEVSMSHRFNDALRAQLAYTYLDATVRSAYLTCTGAKPPCTTPVNTVATGSRVPGAPENDLYAALNWGRDTGWRAGINGQYLSSVPVNDLNTAAAPSYGLFGLDGGYVIDLAHWRLHAFARLENLLDTNYVGSVIVNDGNGNFYEPGPGRSIYVGISMHWKT